VPSFSAGSTPAPIKQILFQGLDGQYLAITENGLIQSMDGGRTWGYLRPNATLGSPAWPAGAVGHQLGWGIGPRSCTPKSFPGICDDFETAGLDNWTIRDLNLSTHALSTAQSNSPTQSLLVSTGSDAINDSVQWYRTDIVASGASFLHFAVYLSSLTGLSFDAKYEGNFFWRCHAGPTGEVLIEPAEAFSTSGLFLVAGQWNDVKMSFDEDSGAYIALEVNGVTLDVSAYTSSFAGDVSHTILFRTFSLGTAYDSYWDDICLSQGALTWTSFGLYNNNTFPNGTAMPADNAVVIAVAISDGGDPVPTISGTDVAFTEISEDDGLYGHHTEINPTVACHTRVWLIQKDGPSPDWNISGGLSSNVDFRGAYMMVRAEASGTIDTVTFTTEFDDGEDSITQNGISVVYSSLSVETSITSDGNSDLIISLMRQAGYYFGDTGLTSVFNGDTNTGAGHRLGLVLANTGLTTMPAQYYAESGTADDPGQMTKGRVDIFYLLLRLIRLRLS
jgi:hypothetical protein